MSKIKETAMFSRELKTLLDKNYKELSTAEGNILSSAKGSEVKSIFVTSCQSSSGKTVSSINLSYALATEANAKVLLVDCNFHSPKIHELFGIMQNPGLSDYFRSDIEYQELIRNSEYDNLKIMPVGSEIPNSIQVFKSRNFANKLSALKNNFDYVIFDGDSVLGSSDVSIAAKHFDGIIFVVECEKTRWEILQLAKRKAENAGGNVLGVILNKRKYYIPSMLYENI
ncbi:MAG: CpsD/CapB family tyrosine-protein kinase [Candidatus Theseobacter exili]|nr:CpsD/CapB family tyrosine-protein kinase [Candidatus Theseobacter exili]